MLFTIAGMITDPKPTSTYTSTESDNAPTAIVSSTVIIVFVVTSISIFIGGFVIGLCVGRKFCRDSSKGPSHFIIERPRHTPIYEEVLVGAANQQNLQLKDNVAYQAPNPVALELK